MSEFITRWFNNSVLQALTQIFQSWQIKLVEMLFLHFLQAQNLTKSVSKLWKYLLKLLYVSYIWTEVADFLNKPRKPSRPMKASVAMILIKVGMILKQLLRQHIVTHDWKFHLTLSNTCKL